jgi:hypothetical protein
MRTKLPAAYHLDDIHIGIIYSGQPHNPPLRCLFQTKATVHSFAQRNAVSGSYLYPQLLILTPCHNVQIYPVLTTSWACMHTSVNASPTETWLCMFRVLVGDLVVFPLILPLMIWDHVTTSRAPHHEGSTSPTIFLRKKDNRNSYMENLEGCIMRP